MAITLQQIDTSVQNRLRNTVGSVLSQSTRVEAYNRVIDYLQSCANWNCSKRVAYFDYLTNEVDYSLPNDIGITDFKQIKEIKYINDGQNSHTRKFEEVSPLELSVLEGNNYHSNKFCFEDRDGNTILRILSNKGIGKIIADSMDTLTTGRTWAADTTSDASNLAVDSKRSKVGSSCLKFDLDVSQSAENKATIYTSVGLTTPIDASDEENIGHWRLWNGLQNLTAAQIALITSITFIWGSDASATPSTKANYWSKTSTVPSTSGEFQKSWNRMSFDWASAAKTGSPDSSALTYFEIQIAYSSGMTDCINIRIDDIDLFDPSEMEFKYFSTHFVNNNGTWQGHFSTDTIDNTEELLLQERQFNLFSDLALMELFPQKEKSNDDYLRVQQKVQKELQMAITLDGEGITREDNEFEVDGNSNGRSENTQW